MFDKINVKKAAISGAVAAAGGYLLFGEAGNTIPVGGMNIPASIVIAGSVAGASVVSDAAHEYILPMIPQDKKLESVESVALSVVTSGLASAGALRVAGVPSTNTLSSFGLGAGSYLASDYAYHRVLYPDDTVAF